MLHLPRNTTFRVPVEVSLFDGLTPLTGQAANLGLQIRSLDDNTILDNVDGQFRTTPATPSQSMAARPSPNAHIYYNNVPITTQYKRGFYQGVVTNSVTGEVYVIDFSVGISLDRRLGVTAKYDGSVLTLGVWIEEAGVVQTDYTSITSALLLTHEGVALPNGGLSFSEGTNGTFYATKTVAISAGTAYMVQLSASVSRPGGLLTFPLRSELIRP